MGKAGGNGTTLRMPFDHIPGPMSAADYAARAQAALDAAANCEDAALVAEWQAMAVEWTRLATVADWQDSMRAQGHLE